MRQVDIVGLYIGGLKTVIIISYNLLIDMYHYETGML